MRTCPPCDHDCIQGRDCPAAMLALQREIADAGARTTVETFAQFAPSNHPRGMWDVSAVDEAEAIERDIVGMQEELRRAVRYLDMRGLLVRPVSGQPEFVSFAEAT